MPTPTPTSSRSKTASASASATASASKRSQAVPTWQEPMTNFFIRKNNKRNRTPNPSTPKKPIQYLDNTVPEYTPNGKFSFGKQVVKTTGPRLTQSEAKLLYSFIERLPPTKSSQRIPIKLTPTPKKKKV